MGIETSKLWNAPLKNGSSSNMAVNGLGTPQVFSLAANANYMLQVDSLCLIAEFTGAVAIGNKFVADAVGTLSNGLLIEAKIDDDAYAWGNLKRTRDLIEVSQPQGGFNVIAGTSSLFQVFFYIPPNMRLAKASVYTTDDFIKATIRDDLNSFTFLEIFLQGIKI